LDRSGDIPNLSDYRVDFGLMLDANGVRSFQEQAAPAFGA
jgi:hypothetical protein